MIIQGIQPGPLVMTEQPELFWGIIVSMWIGNLFLIILNLPLIGRWVRLVSVPYHFLYPAILVFCAIGVFSLNNNEFDIFVMAGLGVLGYILLKLGCEPAPMLLGYILGPMIRRILAPRLAAFARRSDRVHPPPHQCGDAGVGRTGRGAGSATSGQTQAFRSICRSIGFILGGRTILCDFCR